MPIGDRVLLGTELLLDPAAAAIAGSALVLCALLAAACRRSLQASRAARIAFLFVITGALMQCLAGELLLFLAGGAILGYAMLALCLAGPQRLSRFHALAAAVLIVPGDLALLELVMILAKSSSDLSYSGAGAALGKVSGDGLARFCIALGFGSRLALVALCLPEGRSSAANIASVPGWLLLGLTSTVGAVRLFCAGDFGASCARPGLFALWWIPLLAVVAWQLPRALPAGLRQLQAAGAIAERVRDGARGRSGTVLRDAGGLISSSIIRLEQQLSRWPVAMGALLLFILALTAALATTLPKPWL